MIPKHNQSGVLPPFLPEAEPSNSGTMAPYKVTMNDVAVKFSSSKERIQILEGFLAYREELRKVGITTGFQWIDGSFVEDVENNRGRPPNDIDIITFANRPSDYSNIDDWDTFAKSRRDLFFPKTSKEKYRCDAYFVDLGLSPEMLIDATRYWFGLFSHQRETFLWKGLLEVPLANDDDVYSYLEGVKSHAS